LTSSGINLHSGDTFEAHITYDGTNLALTITDTSTLATWSHTWAINIPATVGGTTAYVGFTGGNRRTRYGSGNPHLDVHESVRSVGL